MLIDLSKVVHNLLPVFFRGEEATIIKDELGNNYNVITLKDRRSYNLKRYYDTDTNTCFPRKGSVKLEWADYIEPMSCNTMCVIYDEFYDRLEVGVFKGTAIIDGEPMSIVQLGTINPRVVKVKHKQLIKLNANEIEIAQAIRSLAEEH